MPAPDHFPTPPKSLHLVFTTIAGFLLPPRQPGAKIDLRKISFRLQSNKPCPQQSVPPKKKHSSFPHVEKGQRSPQAKKKRAVAEKICFSKPFLAHCGPNAGAQGPAPSPRRWFFTPSANPPLPSIAGGNDQIIFPLFDAIFWETGRKTGECASKKKRPCSLFRGNGMRLPLRMAPRGQGKGSGFKGAFNPSVVSLRVFCFLCWLVSEPFPALRFRGVLELSWVLEMCAVKTTVGA